MNNIDQLPKHKFFICKSCDKNLSTNQSLKRHIKICKDKLLKCEFCDESVSGQNNLTIHVSTCSKRFQKIILNLEDEIRKQYESHKKELREQDNMYKEQISKLQDKLERMYVKAVEKPTNSYQINNNNNNNNKYMYLQPLNLDPDFIKETVEQNFTSEHFLEGQAGVSKFAYKNFLMDENGDNKYICGDISRGIFYYSKDDKIHKDYKASMLTDAIYTDVLNKSVKISTECYDKKPDNLNYYSKCLCAIKNLKNDPSKYLEVLAGLTVNNVKNFLKKNGEHVDDIIVDNPDEDTDENKLIIRNLLENCGNILEQHIMEFECISDDDEQL